MAHTAVEILPATPPPVVVHMTTVPFSLAYLSGHLTSQRAAGYDVHVISSPGEDFDRFTALTSVTGHPTAIAKAIHPAADSVSLVRIARVLTRLQPSIVHTHTPKASLLGMAAATMCGVAVRVYHCHGLKYQTATGVLRHVLVTAERLTCSLATHVLTVSDSIRSQMIRDGICPGSKVEVLLRGSVAGVDGREFTPATAEYRRQCRRELGIPPESPVIGFVGRVVRDKGVSELVGAWRLLRTQFPNLHLLVVGPFDQDDPVPDNVATELRTDPRIRLTGKRWDTSRLYAAMDLLALPSYREGFPVVTLEAAAAGIPVVASTAPGCVDAVIDGQTGALVPIRDTAALAQALARYLNDPELRAHHGASARLRVLRHYQPEALCRELQMRYAAWIAAARTAEDTGFAPE